MIVQLFIFEKYEKEYVSCAIYSKDHVTHWSFKGNTCGSQAIFVVVEIYLAFSGPKIWSLAQSWPAWFNWNGAWWTPQLDDVEISMANRAGSCASKTMYCVTLVGVSIENFSRPGGCNAILKDGMFPCGRHSPLVHYQRRLWKAQFISKKNMASILRKYAQDTLQSITLSIEQTPRHKCLHGERLFPVLDSYQSQRDRGGSHWLHMLEMIVRGHKSLHERRMQEADDGINFISCSEREVYPVWWAKQKRCLFHWRRYCLLLDATWCRNCF